MVGPLCLKKSEFVFKSSVTESLRRTLRNSAILPSTLKYDVLMPIFSCCLAAPTAPALPGANIAEFDLLQDAIASLELALLKIHM